MSVSDYHSRVYIFLYLSLCVSSYFFLSVIFLSANLSLPIYICWQTVSLCLFFCFSLSQSFPNSLCICLDLILNPHPSLSPSLTSHLSLRISLYASIFLSLCFFFVLLLVSSWFSLFHPILHCVSTRLLRYLFWSLKISQRTHPMIQLTFPNGTSRNNRRKKIDFLQYCSHQYWMGLINLLSFFSLSLLSINTATS